MRRIMLGTWGSLDLFDLGEAGVGYPLPLWLPAGPYRAACLRLLTLPAAPMVDMVAVWVEGTIVPKLRPDTPLSNEQLADILLTEARETLLLPCMRQAHERPVPRLRHSIQSSEPSPPSRDTLPLLPFPR